MSGLDQMIERITANANAQAAVITANANAEAAQILAKAEEDSAARAAAIAEASERDCAACKARMRSAQDQQRRTALLRAKQDAIADLLERAYEAVLAMPEEAYFAFLKNAFSAVVQPQSGEICFNEKDLARLPAGYADALADIATAKGGSLTVSREARAIDGGFVLIYGGIEENCTVRALFDARREALQDLVSGLLLN